MPFRLLLIIWEKHGLDGLWIKITSAYAQENHKSKFSLSIQIPQFAKIVDERMHTCMNARMNE